MASTVLLKAIGLDTQGNALAQDDGSFDVASNIIIKRDNVIESRRGFKLFGNTFGTSVNIAKQLLSYKDLLLRHYNSTLQFQTSLNGEVFSSFSGTYSEPEAGIRIKGVESNGNFYFTTDSGIKKISAKTTDQLSTAASYITNAGGVKALDTQAHLTVTLGAINGFLPADSAVAYRIVWGIKDANGNLVQGTPSERSEVYNPLSNLIAQDLNRLLEALDNVGYNNVGIFVDSAAGWPSGGFMDNYKVPYTADGSSLATQIIALGTAIDEAILYATDSGGGVPLNIVSTAIAGTTCTITVSGASASSYLDVGDKIYLTGFSPTTGTLDGIRTVTDVTGTTIVFVTSATGPVTHSVNATIESGAYRNILATDGAEYDDLNTLIIDTPATHDQLAAIQETLERFMTQLQDEIVSIIGATPQATFITPLAVTTSASVTLEFTIPDDVTVNHFYQVYRSTIVEATQTTVLTDLTPSDELQLVYEAFPTDPQLSAQEVIVEDITPDQFRGANLYTNASTGEGILQANDVPPAAKDINKFKNYTFFANTRTRHRYSLNMLGVQALIDDYNAGITPTLTIATDAGSETFKFITGVAEVTSILCDDASAFTAGQYFTLNSANDTFMYYFWFRIDGAGSDPAVANKTGVVIDILSTDLDADVADKVKRAIAAVNINFGAEIVSSPTVIVTNVDEGPCADATEGTATALTVTVTTQGEGEKASDNEVLLSQLASVARAVDLTARSLVRVINRSTSSVYAYYLSGSTDVPGKMLFESRTLTDTDNPFYIMANSSNTGSSFNPVVSPDLSVNAGTSILFDNPASGQVRLNVTDHGLLTGDQILISGSYNASPSIDIDGIYTITTISSSAFWIVASLGADSTVVANEVGISYLPDVDTSDNEVRPNRVYYSKLQQPESVPLVNTIDVGAEDKAILRIVPLRDSLFVFKEDGLYRISGESSPFTLSLFDASCILVAPDSIGILNNVVYGWTKKGIENITESGVQTISRPIDVDVLPKASAQYPDFRTATWGVGYESDNAYIVFTVVETTDSIATTAYRYSNLTGSWTTMDKTNTCGIVGADDKLYMGAGDTNSIEQERKEFSRTDYADREFEKNVQSGSLSNNGLTILFTSVTDFDIGDVLVQEQQLTIYEYNALLQKLDIDPGVGDANYFSTLAAVAGDNLRTKLVQLATKLDADSLGYSDYKDRITAGAGPYSVAITSVSVANPTVITTAAAHSLYTNRYITISDTDTNASILGTFQVTYVSDTTFSIPANVISVADGVGTFTRNEQSFDDIKACYNILIGRLNTDTVVTFGNYAETDTTTTQEVVITAINRVTKRVTVNQALDFVVGPITLYKHIETSFVYKPLTMGDPLGFKHVREATVMFQNKAFTSATVSFATDLLPAFIDVNFNADSNGIFGMGGFFGSGFFGGASNSAPFRTYVPGPCQRCRYIVLKFTHRIAREQYAIYGVSLTGEFGQSSRAYK